MYQYLKEIPDDDRILIGEMARERVLLEHTAAHRVVQLENYYKEALKNKKVYALNVDI